MKEHVVISKNRTVSVPNSLMKIGIQYDHKVNKITFDCPRYPDEDPSIDMSGMQIFINYMLSDKTLGASAGINVCVDSENEDIMHFDWQITNAITKVKGVLSVLVCIKQMDSDANEIYHWNSDLFQKFSVGEGMECSEVVAEENPDVIAQILTNLNTVDKQITELKKSVSDGKTLVATAITEKGVATENTDSFATMATNIDNISVGSSKGAMTGTNTVSTDVFRSNLITEVTHNV